MTEKLDNKTHDFPKVQEMIGEHRIYCSNVTYFSLTFTFFAHNFPEVLR